ncbi:hypothetical protein ACWGI9_41860 [Streptomyces sp. NPDC054833]
MAEIALIGQAGQREEDLGRTVVVETSLYRGVDLLQDLDEQLGELGAGRSRITRKRLTALSSSAESPSGQAAR